MKEVGFIVGSLRKNSFNKKIALHLMSQFPDEYSCQLIDISQLPLYNQDLDTETPPAPWAAFRERAKHTDAFVFVSPEYNRSVPAALKNALDVGSRPPVKSVWNKKPCAIVTASPGSIGGFGANHHLRQTLVCLGMYTLALPETYLGKVAEAFDESGALVSERTMSFLKNFTHEFVDWMEKFN